MKRDIKASDIIIRLVLFFLWPFGIIPLALSKRIKHKVCLGFIYLALCCLVGLPILMCALLSIAAIIDGYDPSYGYNIAYEMSSEMIYEYESVCVPILVISSVADIYRVIQDRKKIEANQVDVVPQQSKIHMVSQYRNDSANTEFKFYGVDYSSNANQPVYDEKEFGAYRKAPVFEKIECNTKVHSVNGQANNITYKKKSYNTYQKAQVLTEREKNFYETIRLIAEKHNLNVSAKVRLADIVKVSDKIQKQSSLWWSKFEKISQKHIDFALADKSNLEIKLLIEIDDYTHQRPDRIERDKFVDSVCKQANIPILHLYDVIGLEDKIVNILHSEKTEQEM